jgi:hypothetical protein
MVMYTKIGYKTVRHKRSSNEPSQYCISIVQARIHDSVSIARKVWTKEAGEISARRRTLAIIYVIAFHFICHTQKVIVFLSAHF